MGLLQQQFFVVQGHLYLPTVTLYIYKVPTNLFSELSPRLTTPGSLHSKQTERRQSEDQFYKP